MSFQLTTRTIIYCVLGSNKFSFFTASTHHFFNPFIPRPMGDFAFPFHKFDILQKTAKDILFYLGSALKSEIESIVFAQKKRMPHIDMRGTN